MTKQKLSVRLSTLALAVATLVSAPGRVAAQDVAVEAAQAPQATPAPPTPAIPPAPPRSPRAARGPTSQSLAEHEARLAEARSRIAEAHAQIGEAERRSLDAQFKMLTYPARVSPSETPVVIVTQPMDATAATELKEDLAVMDRLLRDGIADAGNDGRMRANAGSDGGMRAMGIKLFVLNRAATVPMYVEGAGAIFSASVGWPLAPSGNGAARRDDRPQRDRLSAWVRAQRELKGSDLKEAKFGDAEPPAFDQTRVDDLVAALVKILPEAINFRHLKENESVFITIVGADEAGAPRRMTLKASKADIDAAAGGKLDAEAFRQRVAFQIGQ